MAEATVPRMQAQPPAFRKEAHTPMAQAPAPKAAAPVQEAAKPADEALYQPKPAGSKTTHPSGCARRRPLTAEEILEKLRKPPHHAA
jgi:hypothetical protein